MPERQPPLSFDIDKHRGEHALLLLFTPSAKSPSYQEQVALVEEVEDELMQRDALILRVLDDGESRVGRRRLTEESARHLQEVFDVDPESFEIVLVGKDGGLLVRDGTPLKAEAIVDHLDGGSSPSA